jgi:predicted LPLAT superfamily acyltransferase
MTTANSKTMSAAHWSNLKEAGTLKGLLFLAWLQRTFGHGVFSVVLLPVAIYFCLFRPIPRQSSLDFLQTHYQQYPELWKSKPGYWTVIKHFYSFGQSILDKLLAWTMPMSVDEFEITDQAALDSLLDDDQGQLIIGSHLGNLEYCRGFVQRYMPKTINALVYDKHAENFVSMMQNLNPESRISVYQVDELDIPLILKLKAKVDTGEWLFIAGDRVPLSGDQRTVPVNFMGRQANLPIGPYMLAKALQSKVKLMFSYRQGDKVKFTVKSFADRIELPRDNKELALQEWAQQYINALEAQCKQAPLQWFNFYPYWADSPR